MNPEKTPPEWSTHTLGELTERFLSGGTPSTGIPEYWNGSIPWITGADAEQKITITARQFLTDEGVRNSSTSVVPRGNILLVTRTGVGKVSIAGVDVAISQDLTGIIPKEDYVDAEFLYWQLKHQAPERMRLAQGTIILGIQREEVRALSVPTPPLPEQRKIAHILTTVDDLIDRTEALIAKLRAIKQGLMHDLLTRGVDEHGQLRPPREEAPALYKESAVGWAPREWEVRTVRQVAIESIQNGYFKKPELVGSGYKLVNVTDLYQEYGLDLNHSAVERVSASAKEYAKFAVQPGDIFFTRSSLVLSGIAHCNIVRIITEPAIFECHVMRLRPNKQAVLPEYLAFYCRSERARQFLMAQAKQTTMTTISQPELQTLLVPLPDLSEQTVISNALLSALEKIETEVKYMDKLQQTKTGLMQDLLTGQVRVKSEEQENKLA